MIKLQIQLTRDQREEVKLGYFPYKFCVDEFGHVYAYYRERNEPDDIRLWRGPLPVKLKPRF